MHLIRRSVCRAVSSPSALHISKPRSITTISPFLLRSRKQVSILEISKRFSSNVGTETQEPAADTSSADQSESSSIRSAISSATESASTYASDAAESAFESASHATESISDAAQAAGAAAGFSAPRGERAFENDQNYRPRPARGPPPPSSPTNSLYVGNLLFEIAESDLRREFSQFGDITNIIMATDARGLSKGFAYIEFDSVDSATAAMQALNAKVLEGRRMIVNYRTETKRSNAGRPPPGAPSKTLFIGNLAFEMTDADLNKLFMSVKNVIDVRVAIDRRTGQPRGFAHADFTDEESAAKGMEYLQGREVYGRPMRVDFSATTTPGARSERSRGSRDYHGSRGDRGDRGAYEDRRSYDDRR